MTKSKIPYRLFYKNIALALILAVFLGPVGTLYSSVMGGTILILIGIIVFSAKFIFPIILLWLLSCIVSVGLAERYNRKLLLRGEKTCQ